jgi:FKBP-type peptidyl-prolyl cis-trans isomerase FkpA
MKYTCFILLFIVAFFLGCNQSDPVINNPNPIPTDTIRADICGTQKYTDSIAVLNNQSIHQYIADKHLIVDSTSTGLYYAITDSGIGLVPNDNSYIYVKYTGYLTNDTLFDTSGTIPIEFLLQNTIQGWRQGLPLIKKSGKIKLIIPAALAYGCNEISNIPINSVLIFDIELVNVR